MGQDDVFYPSSAYVTENLNEKVKNYNQHEESGIFYNSFSSPTDQMAGNECSSPIIIKSPHWKVKSSLAKLNEFKWKGHPPPFSHFIRLAASVQKDMHGKNARVS